MGKKQTGKIPFRQSISISPFSEAVLKAEYVFDDGCGHSITSERGLQELFIRHGANEMFTRISTDRYNPVGCADDHSLEKAVRNAALAAELGVPLNPEIMCLKHYGDYTCQPAPDFSEYPEITLPGLWNTLTVEEMLPVLRKYGALVAGKLLKTGVRINVWDIGNEVNLGFAGVSVRPYPGIMEEVLGKNWYRAPDAVDEAIGTKSVQEFFADLRESEGLEQSCISWLETHVWPHQAKLMNAVKEGICSVAPDAVTSTHITHLTPRFALAFYRAMQKEGFDPDILGLSFYPSNPVDPENCLPNFRSMIRSMSSEFGLPIFLSEYGYPSEPLKTGIFRDWNNQIQSYELTPDGQAKFLYDLTQWGAKNGICGIRPWGPDIVFPDWLPFSFFNVSKKRCRANPVFDSMQKALQ